MKKYYMLRFFYLNKNLFLIWYNDEEVDGFITNESKIIIFDNITDATNYAKENAIFLEQGITTFNIVDIDNLSDKIKNVVVSENCHELFDIWNILGDMAKSTNTMFSGNSDDELTRNIYEKLFYGSNLKVIVQDMGEYHPIFDEEEMKVCISIFSNGLDMLNEIILEYF